MADMRNPFKTLLQPNGPPTSEPIRDTRNPFKSIFQSNKQTTPEDSTPGIVRLAQEQADRLIGRRIRGEYVEETQAPESKPTTGPTAEEKKNAAQRKRNTAMASGRPATLFSQTEASNIKVKKPVLGSGS